jgi:hypothetical protein
MIDIKYNLLNKVHDASGFLALYMGKNGIEILPQTNTHTPQILPYRLYLGSTEEKFSILATLR